MKFTSDILAPLHTLKEFDASGSSGSFSLLANEKISNSEVGTLLSYLQNMVLFQDSQNDIIMDKIVHDMMEGLRMEANITTAEGLDFINEFAYDPVNTPVHNPMKEEIQFNTG